MTVRRSDDYIRARRLLTGENDPQDVSIEIDTAQLTQEARAIVLGNNRGIYPASLEYLGASWGHGVKYKFAMDAEPEDMEPRSMVMSRLIQEAYATDQRDAEENRLMLQAKEEASVEKQKADVAKAVNGYLANPRNIGRFCDDGRVDIGPYNIGPDSDHFQAVMEAHETRKAAAEELERKQKAEEERIAQERNKLFGEWVEQHGTDNQKARWAMGMLPEQEAIDCMEDVVFAPLDARFERCVPIAKSDFFPLCDDDKEWYELEHSLNPRYETEELKELSADEYEVFAEIKQEIAGNLPSGTTIKFSQRIGTWDCGNKNHPLHEIRRNRMIITTTVGVLTFKRMYAFALKASE